MASAPPSQMLIEMARRNEDWFSLLPPVSVDMLAKDMLATHKFRQHVVFPTFHAWSKPESERERHYALAPDVGLF
jgi:hypothetical protein